MVKVIIFDFGGVLGSDADEWDTTFKETVRLAGLPPQKIRATFEKHWPKLKIGKESMKAFWQEIAGLSKTKAGVAKLARSYNQSIAINKKVLNFAGSLKKKYKIVILMSESRENMRVKIKKFSLRKIFARVYCSATLGLAKPDPDVFKYVLRDLKVKPPETLFIDNQKNNIDVAKSLGMKAILFKNLLDLRGGLNKFI